MRINIQILPGRKCILDKQAYTQLAATHQTTSDGCLEVVYGVIHNQENEYLHIHYGLENVFMLPGGYITTGEKPTNRHEALSKKLKQQLDLTTTSSKTLGSIKKIINNTPCLVHYLACKTTGTPRIMHTNNTDRTTLERLGKETITNPQRDELAIGYKIHNIIYSQYKDCITTANDMYTIDHVLTQLDVPSQELTQAPIHLPSSRQKNKQYTRTYCTQQKKYILLDN